MGLPGDTLYTRGRQLFRKAKGEKHFRKVSEAYVSWQAPEQAAFHSYDMKVVGGVVYAREHMIEGVSTLWTVDDVPVVKAKQRQIARAAPEPIPAGRYIMLGDCRNNAYDSHRWGFVSRQQLIGPVLFRYWPLWRLRAFSLNSR